MNSQLQIPCLGRPFSLGMLYDSHSEGIIHGVTLWDDKKLKSAVKTVDHRTYDYEIITEDTIEKKSSSLKITADMKLSILAGMVDIKGAAKYLHDRKSSEKQCRVTLQYKSTTHCDTLIVHKLGKIKYPQVLHDFKPTHLVTAIEYGADAFLVFDRSISEGEALDRVSGGMEAAVKRIPLLPSANTSLDRVDNKETEKFRCKVFGDFLPKSNPTTFDHALKFSTELPAILKKNATPKIAHLTPLATLVDKKYKIKQVIPISPQPIPQVEGIMEYFHYTEVRASDLSGHNICHKFDENNEQLPKFIELLKRYRVDFIEKLSKILLEIRSGDAQESSLTELISSVKKSPFSPCMTEKYLKGKEKEIKLLAQHLKNMEKNSKIQFDFPDTVCDLTTLANDDKFDHVISFAFNVTSKTSAYLGSLETGATNPAEDEGWFDKPSLTKQLSTEIDTFIKLSASTKKVAFVVTSKTVGESSPSMTVYNRVLGSSSSFDLPAPPRASKVTINSIKLTWESPKRATVESYKVLYQQVGKSKFTALPTQGHVKEFKVSNLLRDVQYGFKIQTDILGFTVESGTALIATTEYYDIVLIGRTGQGKSTLGNKLLDLENTDESTIRSYLPYAKKKRFIQAGDPEVIKAGTDKSYTSVTQMCEVMSNEDTKIRVLDVPGFSASGDLLAKTGCKNISVNEGNLQIVRWIVKEQIKYELKVRRILYFLPVRGPLEKADGTLQEELKVLHHYFGPKVFNCMVAVATQQQRKIFQDEGIGDHEFQQTEEVLHLGLKKATSDENIKCPPVIFIGLNESSDEVLQKVQTAIILKESILPLEFSDEVCARCSLKIRSDKKGERVCVVDADGNGIPYEESKCHTSFVPKYSNAQKFFGGVGHMATLGIGLLVKYIGDVKVWPGFTNSDEICEKCEMSPGSKGCLLVGEEVTINSDANMKTLKAEHSNKL